MGLDGPWEIVRRWGPDIVRRNPGNDRLESSLTAVTRRPIPMVSRRVMSKGVGVGLGSQTLPDLLDLDLI